MTEIGIYETGEQVSLPSSWDEMTPEQVQFVFRTYGECILRGGSPLESMSECSVIFWGCAFH